VHSQVTYDDLECSGFLKEIGTKGPCKNNRNILLAFLPNSCVAYKVT